MSLSTSVKRVALVTGSGKKRVGWHVADALAGQGYGIAVHYRTSAKEAAETVEHFRSRGVEAVAFQADLAEKSWTCPLSPGHARGRARGSDPFDVSAARGAARKRRHGGAFSRGE